MKKLSVILSLVIASFLFFTTSCGTSSSSSSPGDISKKIIKDVEKGNVNAVIAFYSKEITDEDKDLLTKIVELGKEGMKEEGGIKTIEIIEEDINEAGDKANVKSKIIYVNEEEEKLAFEFVMEDGKWKLSMIGPVQY
jgi:ABC-type transporter MlaC component